MGFSGHCPGLADPDQSLGLYGAFQKLEGGELGGVGGGGGEGEGEGVEGERPCCRVLTASGDPTN